MTVRMLVSLGNQQKVNLTQRVNSKMLISGQKRLNVDFTLKRDSKDVEFP